jgi:hypothetical protein
MSVNPIDSNATNKPTGSLEELFRHHLAEAAVPPAPMLWDQIDNSLLLQQNESYRRRLATMRWVAAASLLLATLAGTGWWARRDAIPGGSMATTSQPAANNSATGTQRSLGNYGDQGAEVAAAGTIARTSRGWGVGSTARTTAAEAAPTNLAANSRAVRGDYANGSSYAAGSAIASMSAPAHELSASTMAPRSAASGAARQSGGTAATPAAYLEDNAANAYATARPATPGSSAQPTLAPAARPATTTNAGSTLAGTTTLPTTAGTSIGAAADGMTLAAEQWNTLASRSAALEAGSLAALPTGLAAATLPADGTLAAVAPARKWQFGASYAAGVFNPNINFSRVGIDPEFDYNPALGENSAKLTEAAAAEYRDNLRGGIGQRVAVRATRRLAGRWALSTGVEVSQNQASSASSVAFVGEQLPDFVSTTGPMRTTNTRYRLAGIPLEVRYADPVKRGWSAYGRLGAVVSALLSVRTEVEGEPEATRTYSIASAGTPYRRVMANVRGGAGAQYRPATGNWAFTLGPVAEAGLLSLNAHPAQSFGNQSRAYSFGLEAGVEFGRGPK